MPLTLSDIKRISELLGITGAIAGLRESEISEPEFRKLAVKAKLQLNPNAVRSEIIERLVIATRPEDLKPLDELLKMSYDGLIQYFEATSVSNSVLLNLMKDLNYKVSSEDKKHLRRFVARQISETALFSNVASREEKK